MDSEFWTPFLFVLCIGILIVEEGRIMGLRSLLNNIDKSKIPDKQMYVMLILMSRISVNLMLRARQYETVLKYLCETGKIKGRKIPGLLMTYEEVIEWMIEEKKFSRDWSKIEIPQTSLRKMIKEKDKMLSHLEKFIKERSESDGKPIT